MAPHVHIHRIFLEETSLVARPAIGFQDLKDRLDARLKWLGIKVSWVQERRDVRDTG
jgi:lycopene beta-cyclase